MSIYKISKCTDTRCKICRLYLQCVTSFNTASGKKWEIKNEMSCSSKNVIYFLKCNFCEVESYIGKTNNIRLRTNQHISSCRTGNGSDIFDLHVYNCKKEDDPEPYFKLYLMLKKPDESSLLTYEHHFHCLGYDTLNRN